MFIYCKLYEDKDIAQSLEMYIKKSNGKNESVIMV